MYSCAGYSHGGDYLTLGPLGTLTYEYPPKYPTLIHEEISPWNIPFKSMKSQLNPSHFPMKITKSPIIPINKIPGVQGARRFPVESILEPAAVRKPCDSPELS